MPSGSHGGSSGSHSSGGSSFGGHSSRGGSSRSFGSGPRGPRRFRWGGRVYVLTDKHASRFSAFMSGIIISIFFAIIGFIILMSTNSYLKKIETDYYYYQDMISYAESHHEYLKTGYVTDHFYNYDCEKWYYTYKIARDDASGSWLEGYTYSCYTREEIKNIKIGSEIRIAVNSSYVTDKTDSIPLDYKNMPLSRDGEYVDNLGQKRIAILLLVISGSCCTLFIGLEIRLVVKHKQLEHEFPTENTSSTSNQTNSTKVFKKCAYCGKVAKDENAHTCPHCGAELE